MKELKSRKLFTDTNKIEKKEKMKKYEDEENLAYDSKYSSKIKQEEDKIIKRKLIQRKIYLVLFKLKKRI